MHEQNIYDNPTFFDGYRKLRKNPLSANAVIEQPALFSLCPEFKGKTVLDLGCGYGENCKRIADAGAEQVVGIDISAKMLAVANTENSGETITLLHLSMNQLSKLSQTFDIVLSSLAVHYIEDFDTLAHNIHRLLNPGGLFIFSQEHPLTTALGNYGEPGERTTHWIVDGVIKYHRSFSDIVNALAAAGFVIEKSLEPRPHEEVIQQDPSYQQFVHKPLFLLIRAKA